MSDAMRSYLQWRNQNDVHARPEQYMELAECDCEWISPAEVQVGDFKYYYSDQLDAFTLYEVVKVDHAAGGCSVVVIDTDGPEVESNWPRIASLRPSHCDNFYRPSPADRERVERNGFQSQYVPLFPSMTRPIQRRHLTVRLYYKPPAAKVAGWFKRFFNKE